MHQYFYHTSVAPELHHVEISVIPRQSNPMQPFIDIADSIDRTTSIIVSSRINIASSSGSSTDHHAPRDTSRHTLDIPSMQHTQTM
jgi:hypothetical protein